MNHKIDILKLGQDLYEARNIKGYDTMFRVKMVSMEQLNPYRAWLHYQDDWWPLNITLDTYPIITRPRVYFEGRVPPCPKHPKSWHPNVFDDGKICWGEVRVFPEMRVGGLLNMLYGMLHNPNHGSPVPDRCTLASLINIDVDEIRDNVTSTWRRFAQTIEEADRRMKSGEWQPPHD